MILDRCWNKGVWPISKIKVVEIRSWEKLKQNRSEKIHFWFRRLLNVHLYDVHDSGSSVESGIMLWTEISKCLKKGNIYRAWDICHNAG